MDDIRTEWNSHYIRRSRNIDGGVPDIVYSSAEVEGMHVYAYLCLVHACIVSHMYNLFYFVYNFVIIILFNVCIYLYFIQHTVLYMDFNKTCQTCQTCQTYNCM